jgi:starch synthase (maltosyl-transferring)
MESAQCIDLRLCADGNANYAQIGSSESIGTSEASGDDLMPKMRGRLEGSQPPSSVLIENVRPAVDCGRYPIKREIGDLLRVTADIFKDGHDKIAAFLKLRKCGSEIWTETEMSFVDNDLWAAEALLSELGRFEYTIEAFPDRYATWHDEVTKKVNAGLDVTLEVLEGELLVQGARELAQDEDDIARFDILLSHVRRLAPDNTAQAHVLLSAETSELLHRYRPRHGSATLELPLMVNVDPISARFAAWYELFPRSMGTVEGDSATFDDVIDRIPAIEAMGFDVLYFTPIHPIGKTNRKGKNNTLGATEGDPGVPYAIGSDEGGHDAIEPALGSIEDFQRLVRATNERGMEIALDLAIQSSPDHPWAKNHPDWFHIRPDGSIRFSENPPKKYEDIFPVNFDSPDWIALWTEIKRVVLFWVENGVKMFRVDNPHTKPFPFWEWLISEVHRDYPEVIFLSEAFTRPKVMKALAKAGFAQSYSYFTWRNFKQEIVDYFTELTQTDVVDYMRVNLFPNTHDILPVILQRGGRPAFKMRLVLAATLSSVYGIYSGYELCENTPVPGKEEYLNSEKYEYKVWDWDRPGNIIDYVTLINQIRRNHPALQEYDNLRFYWADDTNFVCYGKTTPDLSDIILVVVNLDPLQAHETMFHFPVEAFGLQPGERFLVTELITGDTFFWDGGSHHVFLDPNWQPALIYSINRWAHVDYVERFV